MLLNELFPNCKQQKMSSFLLHLSQFLLEYYLVLIRLLNKEDVVDKQFNDKWVKFLKLLIAK